MFNRSLIILIFITFGAFSLHCFDFGNASDIRVIFYNDFNQKQYEYNVNDYELNEILKYIKSSTKISVDEVPLIEITEGKYSIIISFENDEVLEIDYSLLDTFFVNEIKSFYSSRPLGVYLKYLAIKMLSISE